MSKNFVILVIIMSITSQAAQENECPLGDTVPGRRKCWSKPDDKLSICCNFKNSSDSECIDIFPEHYQLSLDFEFKLQPFRFPCIIILERNAHILEEALENLLRSTFKENSLSMDSFRAIVLEEFLIYPYVEEGLLVLRLIFSQRISINMTEDVAVAALSLEKKKHFTILGFNATLQSDIHIFHTRYLWTRESHNAVDWCSSSRLHFCPPRRHCEDRGLRYKCICDNGYVDTESGCVVPVRLEGSLEPHQGRVEYFTKGVWYTICSEAFGPSEARVVCRQLGYDGREARIDKEANFTMGPKANLSTSFVSVYDFNCRGKERSLLDCEKQPLNNSCCAESDSVYVSCGTDCPDDNHYGPNCTLTCGCLSNNTEVCERYYGSCVCSEGWKGENCTDDVDECALGTKSCTLYEQCENTYGGHNCTCLFPEYNYRKNRTYCFGSITVAEDLPFKTNGSQDMTLICNPANLSSHVLWSIVNCSQTSTTCVFRPVPDDDYTIYCSVNERRDYAKVTLNLTYPPSQAPEIIGYKNGDMLQAGKNLSMICSVKGGKPLVRAVNFSCPGHPDGNDSRTQTGVESSLQFYPVLAKDNGITCTCTAEWEDPTFYHLSDTRNLTFIEADNNKDRTSEADKIGWFFGGVALIVCLAIIVLGVWRYKWRSTYESLSRRRMDIYSIFAHSFTGDEISEEYAEIEDASLYDHMDGSATTPSATGCRDKDESDIGYFYGTFFTSAVTDTEKKETLPSQDVDGGKHDGMSDSKRQICCAKADSEISDKKDYLHPTKTMPLSDEVASPENSVSRCAEDDKDESNDYLHPISTHSCI